MQSLSEVQAAFAAALADPLRPVPAGLSGPAAGPVNRRFAVYRNNVIAGLTRAVGECFPAVGRIVGDEFFAAMARGYVLVHPPRSPLLIDYGVDFADFIEGFAPAASLPYLPDVARIERAWREAYHAAEAEPIDGTALAAVPAEELGGIRFALHPSLRLVTSRFPALTIWRMNTVGPVAAVDFSVAEDALIVRPDAEVEVRVVPLGGAAFVASLGRGELLGDAAALGFSADARFDLAGNLAGLIAAGALVAIRR